MASKKKEKKIYPNNLLKIRESLGYTQKDMGEILEVSERMICNYETGETNLPIDKAIFLAEKYNRSLDWIYIKNEEQANNKSTQDTATQLNKFTVDIRDFVSRSDNMYHFSIPDNYWKYISELNNLLSSNKTENEKKRLHAEMNGKYKKTDSSGVIWRISIPIEEISAYIHFDSNFIPFVDSDNNEKYVPTEEQLKNAITFLNELTK